MQNNFYIWNDFPVNKQISFQSPATPIMEGIINVHHEVMMYLIFIFVFVSCFLINIIFFFNNTRNPISCIRLHAPLLEILWTFIPFMILTAILIPSFALLYAIDEIYLPFLTLKVIGRQWYWTYEYSQIPLMSSLKSNNSFKSLETSPYFNSGTISYDSYMVAEEDLSSEQIRLLSVDYPVLLPIEQHIRILVTSTDVLHSWAIPSFGIKVDAIPGRLNQIFTYIKRSGNFYGQCSELCGVNHAFMPIEVRADNLDIFYMQLYLQDPTSFFSSQLVNELNISKI